MKNHQIYTLSEQETPQISETAWVAPTAVIVGAVTLLANSSVWYNSVLRGDSSTIELGESSNLQDGVVVHADSGFPTKIGAHVSVGHNAVIHGASVEDGCLVGMSATVLNGAVIGEGSLVAAGALVTQGMQVPPKSLVAGVPAKVVRQLTEDEQLLLLKNAEVYLSLTERHTNSQKIQ